MSAKRSITCVTLKDKYDALKSLNARKCQTFVADRYGVKVNTVSGWVKSKRKICDDVEKGTCISAKIKRISLLKF